MNTKKFLAIFLISTGLIFFPICSMRLTKTKRFMAGKQGSVLLRDNKICFFTARALTQQTYTQENDSALHEDCEHVPMEEVRKRYYATSSVNTSNSGFDNQEVTESENDEEYQESGLQVESARKKYFDALIELKKKRSNNKNIEQLDDDENDNNFFLGSIFVWSGILMFGPEHIALGLSLGMSMALIWTDNEYDDLRNALSKNRNEAKNNYKKLLDAHTTICEQMNKKNNYTFANIENYKVESQRVESCKTCNKLASEMKECPCNPKLTEENYLSYLVKMKDV